MTATQRQAIEHHGRQLQALYPATRDLDPVALCKKLRRLEREAAAIGLRLCNGPEYADQDEPDRLSEKVLAKVAKLLGDGPPVFVNRDPRGYALKIREGDVTKWGIPIERDWGGYGLIAPDLTNG